MKKCIMGVTAAIVALAMQAQVLEVTGITPVTLPEGARVDQAVLSPDGSSIAYTDLSAEGLHLLQADGTATLVSPQGIAMDLSFTPDGSAIVYDAVRYDAAHRRTVAVNRYDIARGATTNLVRATRDLQGVTVATDGVHAVVDGRMESRSDAAVLSIDHGQLCITRNGATSVLSPLGTAGMSYLWPSLSPDGTRICFYAVAMGCYTCALDGSDVRPLGWIRAARWYDNNTIVGMHDLTDGRFTTSSAIIAAKADGTARQTLTDEAYIAVLPSTAPGKIAFSTVDGKLYIINVNQ